MDIDPAFQSLAASLTASALRNTAQIVNDRIGSLRAKHQDQETIAGLEQIINDLNADKNELVRIAQAYQSELVAQRLSSGDVRYITENVIPVVRKLVEAGGGDGAVQMDSMMQLLEPLLSVETANVLQLLGFNFRKAIGEPLTELARRAILSRAQADPESSIELQKLVVQQNLAYLDIAQDPEAYARLQKINGQG